MGKDQSSLQIIDWKNASTQIQEQAKKMWSNRVDRFSKATQMDYRILCLINGDQLVGCAALQRASTATWSSSLDQEIGSQKAYLFSIKINDNSQGKGYGRMLFNHACSSIIDEGAVVFFTDSTPREVGDRLYGGEKTRELFDVYYGLNKVYLLKKKTKSTKGLNYLRVSPKDSWMFRDAIDTPEGMNNLLKYFDAYPSDMRLLDSTFIQDCEELAKRREHAWSSDQLTNYKMNISKLKKARESAI